MTSLGRLGMGSSSGENGRIIINQALWHVVYERSIFSGLASVLDFTTPIHSLCRIGTLFFQLVSIGGKQMHPVIGSSSSDFLLTDDPYPTLPSQHSLATTAGADMSPSGSACSYYEHCCSVSSAHHLNGCGCAPELTSAVRESIAKGCRRQLFSFS